MTNLEFQFNQAYQSYGGIEKGILKSTPLIEHILSLLRVEVEVLRKGEKDLPPIYLDLIENKDFNAFATKRGEQYFIGICAGAIIHSIDVFSRMLSANTILPHLGNAANEAPPQKIYDIQFKNTDGSLSFFSRQLIPKDIVRQEAMVMFVKHMVEFLVIHEYAHIVYGHFNYHAAHPTTKDALACQVMETDADSFATFIAMNLLFGTNQLRPDLSANLQVYYKDVPSRLKMWLFPIFTYFRLFGFSNQHYSLEKDIYPPPCCRANIIMDTIHSMVTEEFNLADATSLVSIITNTMMEVEDAFDEVTEWGLDFRASRYGLSQEILSHTKKIMDHRSSVDNLLKDYGHLKMTSN